MNAAEDKAAPTETKAIIGREDLSRVGAGNLGWSLSRCQETHEVDRFNVGPSLYQMQAFGPDYHYSRQEQERVESALLERR